MRRILYVGLLMVWAGPAVAQPKPAAVKPGDAMIDAYLAAETDKLSQKFLDGAKSLDEWTAKRPRLHREYLDMLGLAPLPEKTPLHATITRTFENQGVVIDNLHFQSRPGLYVTGNLYRPKGNTKKLPTVVYLCGHSDKGRDGNKSAYQVHGLWFASNGYNCLVLDSLQLGEIPGTHHGTYKFDRWWWHSAGYTPAGVECWNGIRAVDYLLTRDDVDPAKLGITGISGGGAATIWIVAADDRLKVVVPVSGFSDLESYVKNKVINGHCDCMFLYNTFQWEWTTILALVAPRPLLFANSDNDPIFPMDGNRRVAAKMRTIYGLYGKPEVNDEYVSAGGHAYRPDLRVAVYKFFNRHLKGDATTPVEDAAKFGTIPGKELRVFPTDDDLPKDRINGKVDESFVARGKIELPEANGFVAWRESTIARIRRRSFRPFSERIPPATPFAAGARSTLETQSGIEVKLSPLLGVGKAESLLLYVSGLDDRDAIEKKRLTGSLSFNFPQRIADGRNRILWTRDAHSKWTVKSPPNYVERSHILLGQTIVQSRIRDVLAVRQYLSDEDAKTRKIGTLPIAVAGIGSDAIVAAYAAILDAGIDEVFLMAPPISHRHAAALPGILREIDIPDALGLLAPRPLTIIGDDPAFDRTAEIYRLAGAADNLKRVKK